MAEINIEGLLRSTAAATSYPAASDMRAAVSNRISRPEHALTPRGEGASSRWPKMIGVPRLTMAALLIAALALGGALVMEPSRQAIARFFGVQGSKIEVVPAGSIPTPLPSPTLMPGGGPVVPVPLEQLVTATPLDAIAGATGFEPVLPAGQGSPLASFVVSLGSDRVALLQFEDFDLWEARLAQEASFGKTMVPQSILLEVKVGSEPAYWLSGAPHYVYYVDSGGQWIQDSQRTVEKSTLIWRTDYAFYRIETNLPLEDALRIAVTLP